jgi:hypothetical protein
MTWQRFWFERRTTKAISLVRILFGVTLLMKLTGVWGLYRVGSAVSIGLPLHEFSSPSEYVLDGYRLPVPGFWWLPVPTFEQFRLIEDVQLLLCVALIAGALTRVVAPLLTLALVYPFLLSQFLYNHHLMLFILVVGVLSIAPCADHYSVDAKLRGTAAHALRSVYSLRLLQVLVTLVYLFSALAKSSGGWLSGGVLEAVDATGRIRGPFSEVILTVVSFRLLAIGTFLIEWLLVFGLWVPRIRRWVAVAGVVLHLSIDGMMDVGTFSYEMIALYVVFLHREGDPTRPVVRTGLSG